MKKSILILTAVLFLTVLSACSSAPKRTMQISTVYKNVTTTLETANSLMISGNYQQAENLLASAYSSAMSIDNYDLLTTICLSYVSLYLSYEQPDTQKAQSFIDQAYFCSKYSNDQARYNALCDLSDVRLQLSKGNMEFDTYLTKLSNAKACIKNDPYNEGLFLSVEGDVFRCKKDYINADSAYSAASSIFTKNRYLGEIGITWYKTAQVRSLAGNKQGAIDAIRNAIKYDRDAENSIALGTDYYASGLILLKGTPSDSEKSQADYCFTHSAQIFNSIGNSDLAERSIKAKEHIK